jgi:hypothetical protein
MTGVLSGMLSRRRIFFRPHCLNERVRNHELEIVNSPICCAFAFACSSVKVPRRLPAVAADAFLLRHQWSGGESRQLRRPFLSNDVCPYCGRKSRTSRIFRRKGKLGFNICINELEAKAPAFAKVCAAYRRTAMQGVESYQSAVPTLVY